MYNTYSQLLTLLASDHIPVLGTLLKTHGSVPQVPGATILYSPQEVLCGTLGGGYLEKQAHLLVPSLVQNQESICKEIRFNASVNDKEGAICGGSALFLLDANPAKDIEQFQAMQQSIKQRQSGVLLTIIHPQVNNNCSTERFWIQCDDNKANSVLEKFGITLHQLNEIIHKGETSFNEKEDYSVFIEPIIPNPQLIIVGAGHIGHSLNQICQQLDFDITIVDNRIEFMKQERFPSAKLIHTPTITEAFDKLSIKHDTYIVITTQGHQTDTEALKCCIKSGAVYIGMIGSKRKTELIRKNFIDKQWASTEELNRINAPIGIDIGSQTVPEIAVSIAAELIKTRRQPEASKYKKPVGCLVLAAGLSTRMKQQKLLMPYGKQTIIESIVSTAQASIANSTMVVLGSHKEEIETTIKHLNVDVVINDQFQDGMLSSVQRGINTLCNCAAIVLLLGDQPMINKETINSLIQHWQETNRGLIVPTFKGKRGHPVLIDMKYKNEILNLKGGIGLKELFRNNPSDIVEIEINSDDILQDIDTPQEYKAIIDKKFQ